MIEHGRDGAFYVVSNPLPAAPPGTLIRYQRFLGAPNGAISWRVLYHTRDVHGHDVAASGVVVAPTSPPPASGRPVVSWGHPTTGAATKCAPSLGVDPFFTTEGLLDLLKDGYVVAAADYPGMGAPGPSSYLIGVSEGNSVLDAARAARAIPATHANTDLLLWGHSQGGHAVMFAAQDARTYAPELHLVATAVAAPAAELGSLLKDDIADDSGVTLGAYAFDAYQKAYGADPPVPLTSVLTAAGAAATPRMAAMCLFGANKELHAIAGPLVGHYLAHDPGTIEPWKTWLAGNTPGAQRVGVPILVAQGDADTLVHPATTAVFVQRLCSNGEAVEYQRIAKTGHALVALRALPAVRRFFADALARRPLHSACPK